MLRYIVRYIVVQSCPTDQQWDWYIVDLVKSVCVDRVSGGYAQVTDRVARMNQGEDLRGFVPERAPLSTEAR